MQMQVTVSSWPGKLWTGPLSALPHSGPVWKGFLLRVNSIPDGRSGTRTDSWSSRPPSSILLFSCRKTICGVPGQVIQPLQEGLQWKVLFAAGGSAILFSRKFFMVAWICVPLLLPMGSTSAIVSCMKQNSTYIPELCSWHCCLLPTSTNYSPG